MGKADEWVFIIVLALLFIYVLVLITGFITHKLLYLTSLLNIISASAVLIYWILRQLQIKQHLFDLREITVVCFEVAVAAIAAYAFFNNQKHSWIKIIQYAVYGIHLLALILFLVFILTFKMNRLM